MLHVPSKLLQKYSAESRQATDELVRRLRSKVKADVYAAITGLASAGGSETPAKPVGTVFISMLIGRTVHSMQRRFRGSPATIKSKACDFLFHEAALFLNTKELKR